MEKKIIVVDDDVMNLRMAEMFLKKENYQVEKITSGKECLLFLEEKTADLILLDVEMPDVNGKETLIQLKSNPRTKEIPILFISGSEEIEEEVKQGLYDVNGCIKKPFIPAKLISNVQSLIG